VRRTIFTVRAALIAAIMMSAAAVGCSAATRPADAAEAQPVAFLMGPYVNSVDGSTARVVWVTDAETPAGTVRLAGGSKGRLFRAEVQPIEGRQELLHVAALEGLLPGTRYDYAVEQGSARAEGSFRTAPSGEGPFRFVVYGDTRSRPESHNEVARAIAAEDPDFVVHTGDLVVNGRLWDVWGKEFFGPAMPFLRKASVWPVRGNHEGDAVLYRELFALPGNELYYSFDWGNVHVVVLDSQTTSDQYGAMLEWFRQDLSAHPAQWTFVIYHQPSFNVGGHASRWGRQDFLPVMYEHGVDFAMAGHSHLYERFRPIAVEGALPITFIVTGGGGAPTYSVAPSPMLVGGIGVSETHYCVFDIDGNRLRMTVKLPDGSVIDEMELVKTDGRYQPEVMAQAVDYDMATALTLLFADMKVELPELPGPGQTVEAVLAVSELPAGSVITVGPAAEGSGWTVPEQRLVAAQGTLKFTAVAPQEAIAGDTGGFQPPLKVRLTFEAPGFGSNSGEVALAPGPETLRRIYPEPEALPVPHAGGPMAVDGDLSDWKGVEPLPNPFHGEPTGPFRFCWTEQGLYGAVEVADDNIRVNPQAPWQADGVELFVDKGYERALRTDSRTGQYGISPAPERGPGPAYFMIAHGVNRGKSTEIACAWQPTEDGYTLEFFLPAAVLDPAAMKEGTVIGLNVVLNNDGRAVRQFYSDKGNDGWRTPLRWGAIRLAR